MARPGDCYEYVRTTYGVPAAVGMRVELDGQLGEIVRARTQLHYVHIRLDGTTRAVVAHPSGITYLAEKRCSRCRQWKPRDMFNRRSNAPDGFDGRCRVCKTSITVAGQQFYPEESGPVVSISVDSTTE
jgi:hypothetical protein